MSKILECTLNWNFIAKYCYKNILLRNSKWKIVKITFDSSPDTLYVSLQILVDNFGYFRKKNNLNIIDENENCTKISGVSKEMFEILLKIIAYGKFK